ncbi:MAG: peptide chain release factor-like protein [Planctomycetaceae bacterium]
MIDPVRHPSTLPCDELLAQCELKRAKRSGPGGQHRNKVETAVILSHRPTGIVAEANERRSQAQNREVALFRMRVKLALEVRRATAARTPPSELWRQRCRNGRIAVNPRHEDFPALLAEALDAIVAADMDVKTASQWLRCSPSQLVRLLKHEPRALAWLNARRSELGLRPLS